MRRTGPSVRALALGAALAAASCTEPIPPPAAPPPSLDRPADAIPGDLDVAFRVDLVGLRRVLGPGVMDALQLELTDPKADVATTALVADALSHADSVWLALRPGRSKETTDNVLLLRGRFPLFDPLAPRAGTTDWSAPVDLGGAFRLYERPAPRRRSAPARIYTRADDWVVFVSTAEIDSAERSIELRMGDPHVDPPDRGVLSVAARLEPLIPLLTTDFPALSEALVGADQLEADASADDRGLRATLSVTFVGEAEAAQARERLALLLKVVSHSERLFGRLARGTQVTAVGKALVVRVELDARQFAELVAPEAATGAPAN